VGLLSGPLLLGSWWSLLIILPLCLFIVVRTSAEDRFLHTHLAGYSAYATRVRYRLIPGIW
jgi:protein-S-isoprenylcysteine O-methyltransferase Ste14